MTSRPPLPAPLPSPVELPRSTDWTVNTPERCRWYRDVVRALEDDELLDLYRETGMAQRWHVRDCAVQSVRREIRSRGLTLP